MTAVIAHSRLIKHLNHLGVNLNQFISKLIIRLQDELETDTLKYILETENTYVFTVTPFETRNILRIY